MKDRSNKEHETSLWERSPLLRFLGMHLILGAAIGVAFVSLAILLNLAGLRDLLIEADDPVVPLVLLYSFNVITFANVTMGIGIMILPSD
jgi:hypothetical protein